MSRVIRTEHSRGPALANYRHACDNGTSDDVTSEMIRLAQDHADLLVAEAREQADTITREAMAHAARTQQQAASASAESVRDLADAARRLLERMVAEIACEHRNALGELPNQSFRLAVAIAERIVRQKIDGESDLVLTLVRETLEMLSGCARMRVDVSPQDLQRMQIPLQTLVSEFANGSVHIKLNADKGIGPGGCRVATEHGEVDQTIETQLRRILDELTDAH